MITDDGLSIREYIERLNTLKDRGYRVWFGSGRFMAISPPVVPRNYMCIRCNHKRSGRCGEMCPNCRHRITHTSHEVGGTSSPPKFELQDLQGCNGLPRLRKSAMSRGRNPVSADIAYNGD